MLLFVCMCNRDVLLIKFFFFYNEDIFYFIVGFVFFLFFYFVLLVIIEFFEFIDFCFIFCFLVNRFCYDVMINIDIFGVLLVCIVWNVFIVWGFNFDYCYIVVLM